MAVVSMGGIVSGQTVDARRLRSRRRDPRARPRDRTASRSGSVPPTRSSARSARPSRSAAARRRWSSVASSRRATRWRCKLDEVEVRQAMAEPIGRIVDAARRTLAEAPPELTHDVLGDRHVPDGRRGDAHRARPAARAGVRGARARRREPTRDRRSAGRGTCSSTSSAIGRRSSSTPGRTAIADDLLDRGLRPGDRRPRGRGRLEVPVRRRGGAVGAGGGRRGRDAVVGEHRLRPRRARV